MIRLLTVRVQCRLNGDTLRVTIDGMFTSFVHRGCESIR